MKDWLGTFRTTLRVGWVIWICYSRALERRPLVFADGSWTPFDRLLMRRWSRSEVMGVMWRCNRSNWRLLLFCGQQCCWNRVNNSDIQRTERLGNKGYRGHRVQIWSWMWPPRLFWGPSTSSKIDLPMDDAPEEILWIPAIHPDVFWHLIRPRASLARSSWISFQEFFQD